jgi:phenylpropionate dioxygenase-like ring-hydroxylating dioxygenase large terminal subunit
MANLSAVPIRLNDGMKMKGLRAEKKRPTDKNFQINGFSITEKNDFLFVCVGKPTDSTQDLASAYSVHS